MRQVSPFRKKTKQIFPNQYICRENGSHVECNGNYYPFQVYSGGGTITCPKGCFIYIRSITSVGYNAGLHAESASWFLWTAGNLWEVATGKCILYLPATAAGEFADASTTFFVGVTTDYDIQYYTEMSNSTYTCVYAIIDKIPGLDKPKVVES